MQAFVVAACVLLVSVTYVCTMGQFSDQFLESIERTKVVASPGRHVCTTENVISRPVPVLQTYKKPVYTSRPRDCPNHVHCPQYDVAYIPANRTVYQLQRYSKFQHNCCPGWTKTQKREKGCMGPICKNGCGEFGVCVKPDVCQCQMGFAGDMCDTDIDECKSRDHGCTQVCKNTAGSYMCACQEGFVLAEDGRTCNFCFQCQQEYKLMMSMVADLQRELDLQTEKANLQNNMTQEIQQLQQEVVFLKNKNTEKTSLSNNMTQEIRQLQSEVVFLQTKNKEVEEIQSNTTSAFLELRSEVAFLTQENLELKSEIASLERNQTLLVEDMNTLKLAPPPPPPSRTKPSPSRSTSLPTQVDTKTTTKSTTTARTTTSTTTTGRLPTTSEDPFHIEFDPIDLITSLSNQIGLMEEKLDLCSCVDRGRHRP